ncbi:MAG TPA: [FeFe] hydrogenase H-cluster maturation GTPase HydF [Bacteroidales bacterium]|nr:[FeFe] hydrogenase H-cluster maturation GTPase HydF [Bacteroidales bacterium]HPZ02835.1 [FeFe] hydrogenase H-cluster maturation GTPase HydF [Bacteroidales bacterium]HQB74282.1 [FeFe] hydrogenase H-cluster maturation GTPase HydF [Bacteroidales bacterium]
MNKIKGINTQPYLGIIGRRNTGKSSLINALAKQDLAIVSDIPGTTTDPVKKSIEILGIGPTIIIDTPGYDDVGELGLKRVQKALEVFKLIDFALLVVNNYQIEKEEQEIILKLEETDTPFLIVNNKVDQWEGPTQSSFEKYDIINVSASTLFGIDSLVDTIVKSMPKTVYQSSTSILGDILNIGEQVLLITPIDSAAPEGRLILPQVQTIRDILDHQAIAIVLKETELEDYLLKNRKPDLVITDSKIFPEISKMIPEEIPLTSFSIILAHQKGDFYGYLKGTTAIENLQSGDHILILESCTHTTSCDDIGRVKIPNWLQEYTKKQLRFTVISGLDPIPNYSQFKLIVQCGGCMITKKQIMNRLQPAINAQIPITNYGMLIAYISGIFYRATAIFR